MASLVLNNLILTKNMIAFLDPNLDSVFDAEFTGEKRNRVAVLRHLFGQPGRRLPRLTEDHGLRGQNIFLLRQNIRSH